MASIHVTTFTDPACPWSWAAEPAVRRVQVEFGDQVSWSWVMGGLAREVTDGAAMALQLLEASAASGMPVDARGWLDGPPRSSYPACQGVKAAAEQGRDGDYLRAAREALMVDRRPADTIDGLLEVARAVPGLDLGRFAVDVRSNAIVEALGADLERARAAAPAGQDRVGFPTFDVGGRRVDDEDWRALRAAVVAAGGEPGPLPGVEDAVRRFGRIAAAEVAAVCDLPPVRAEAELWRLATELRVRPERVGTGALWRVA